MVIGVIALVAIALWPLYRVQHVAAIISLPRARVTQAPVMRDDLTRNIVVAFYERRVRNDSTDQISAAILSVQYLQRYREAGDIGDVTRALGAARHSLQMQPRGNTAAQYALASALLTLHRFREALAALEPIRSGEGTARAVLFAKRAALYMELGEYAKAQSLLARIPPGPIENPAVDTVVARYEQLTGRLAAAREHLRLAQEQQDTMFEASAESRAWYHFRAGELAFQAGAVAEAIADERNALIIFPHYSMAHNALARFLLATGNAKDAYTAAGEGAAVLPLPETLGYRSDAAAALGRHAEALEIRDEIFAIEKLGAVYGTNDRLLAVYYADHNLRPQDALRIARLDARVRGDEIYAQDTLAWAAAKAGSWNDARTAMQKALRHNTEDALLHFHAGIIAQHFNDRAGARMHFAAAIRLNPQFHPVYAPIARRLSSSEVR